MYQSRSLQLSKSDADRVKRVIVFIPALNEEEKIGEVIQKISEYYEDSNSEGFLIETIVVDDGSTDSTVQKAQDAGVREVISHSHNLGLGAATRTGMQMAFDMGADVAVKMDADFQHDPEDIKRVVEPILKERADIVYGSRFTGRINYRMPMIRHAGNKFFTWLMRRITGWPITDAQTGLMAYSRKYLADFNIVGDYNAPQQIVIDAYNKHLCYAEVPVVFHARTTGDSFVSLRYPFKVLPQILRIMMLGNPLKIFVNLGFVFLLMSFLIGCYDLYLYIYHPEAYIHETLIAIFFVSGIQAVFFGLLADLVKNNK